jgi:hypothetical protein
MDTGGRTTIIRPDLAEVIGVDLREDHDSEVVGVGGASPVSRGTIEAVHVLGHPVRNVEVVRQELHPTLAFDGMLGLNVLRYSNITIDDDEERLRLEPCRG